MSELLIDKKENITNNSLFKMTDSQLPKGWEMKKMVEVVNFQRGLTYSKKDEVDFSDNVVLRSNNVDLKTNNLDLADLKYINSKIVIPENKKVTKGSLIICTANGSKSHLGKVALINDDCNYAFGGFMGLIKPKGNLNSEFLFYLMISEVYKKFIGALSDGANINNLKFGDLGEFKIPLPSLPEQQRIVSVLDKAFEAINQAKENAEQNLKNTKEIFENYSKEVFENENWAIESIDNVCDRIFAGGDAPKSNFSTEQNDNYPIPIYANAVKDRGLYGYTDSAKVTRPSITVAARGSGTGHTELRTESFFPIVRLIVCIPNTSKITLDFLKYSIDNLVLMRSGSAIPQLTVPMIKEYNLPLPSLPEQEYIVQKLGALSAETKKLAKIYRQKINDLEELKKTIIQSAFNGDLTKKEIVA